MQYLSFFISALFFVFLSTGCHGDYAYQAFQDEQLRCPAMPNYTDFQECMDESRNPYGTYQ